MHESRNSPGLLYDYDPWTLESFKWLTRINKISGNSYFEINSDRIITS